MHFSLIQPRPRREREAAYERMRGGAYADHQWLWERFFAAPGGTPRDFLFRRLDAGVAARFYAVSARAPRNDVPGWEARLKRYEPRPNPGERLHFDLRANPVVSRASTPQLGRDGSPESPATGKRADSAPRKVARHDVVMDAKRRLLAERGLKRWQDWTGADKPPLYELARQACGRWLASRGYMHGFALDEDSFRVEAYTQHCGKDDRLRFSSADLSGVLTVLDAERFRSALTQGVGHAKAFGCGLLLVRRLT